LDAGLALPAVVLALQVTVEEAALQRDALGEQEGEEVRPRLDLQPLVARGDAAPPEDRAAQVQAQAAPVRDYQRRHLDAVEAAAARFVPFAVQRARAQLADVVGAVRRELLRRQA